MASIDLHLPSKQYLQVERTVSRLMEMQSPDYLALGHGAFTA